MPNPTTGSIPGVLKIEHSVDPNGSLCLDIPIKVPPAKLAPDISISYHSAIHGSSVLGHGWELKAFGFVQRTARTIAQDGFSGSVNYDADDRYTLNGQRLVKVSEKEYRFEVEKWSKIVVEGTNPANPDNWIEYLPDGTIRRYGSTKDSKALAIGQEPATRMWALAEICDPFSNYTSYSYVPADNTGSLILDSISYGGNKYLKMEHQRMLKFSYTDRTDIYKEFEGGSPVCLTKRLASISASFNGNLIHAYTFNYDYAPVTGVSRLQTVTLSDASKATVSPLTFTWSKSATSVFDNLSALNSISRDVSDLQVLTVDVDGSGRTGLVLAWKEWDPDLGINVLSLDVHLADGMGNISTESQPGSGSTGLPYPDQLLALDVDGDGKMDLLHVIKDEAQRVYTLTVLLSTKDGYKPQNPITFKPDVLDGHYYTGDFQGNGNVGLVYLYNEGSSDVRLIQFTSDGKFFSPQPVVNGPGAIDLTNAQVVIADFDGNGASDIFLVSPKDSSRCEINFFQSKGGYLQAQLGEHNPFATIGDQIEWLEGTAFLALPEQDGKTGLLLLSKSADGKLMFQMLRSTGKSLEVSPSNTTTIFYGGIVSLGHTTSMNSLDLVTAFKNTDGIEVSVLHLFNGTFEEVTRVTLGTDLEGFDVTFVDLRGIGRADCLFSIYNNASKKLELRNLPCAGASEAPADLIVGHTGGLGATLSITYASLTNSDVYTGSDKDSRAPVNALSGQTSSMLAMSGSTLKQHATGSTRTRLAHFPKFVVEELTDSGHPGAVLRSKYFYTNGRISFDGRGWLGFDTISRHSDVLGTVETKTYYQEFPFIGAVSKTEIVSASDPGNILKRTTYVWEKQFMTDQSTHCYAKISSIQQTLYEKGSVAYCVDVGHVYDSYANIVQTDIATGPKGKPGLVITKEYSNDEANWIIGSKLSESITSDGRLMKRINFKYVTGKQVVNQVREWVSESSSSEKNYSFDAAGNVTRVTGPWQAQNTFIYDSTYSFPIKETISVDDKSALTASALYDYGTGQVTSMTEYNGCITIQQYDVLGRVIARAEERSDNITDKWEYSLDRDGHAVRTHYSLRDQASGSWIETEYLDGMGRTWKKALPSVSDPSITVYTGEVALDGVGRIIRRYRNYTSTTSQPAFSTYSYDAFSRKTKVVTPPPVSGEDPVTTTYDYSCDNYRTTVAQTRSGDSHHGSTTTRSVLEYFPNPETQSPDFVVPLCVASIDELGCTITTAFDALHRVVSVTDAGGVCMSQQWDGISRQTGRKVSNPEGMSPETIAHFSIDYDDASRKTTINNLCAKSSTIILKDRLDRTTKKTTPNEEELSFKYDDVQARAQGRLSSVISSKGISEAFSYDTRGSLQSTSLEIDDQNFTTSFGYTNRRQLSKIVNPDGSVLTRTFFDNSNTVKKVELLDDRSSTNVSATYSHFDNAFFLPQIRDMGNGLKSTINLSDSGLPMKAVLSKGDTTLHQQTWEINNFGRLDAYNPSSSEDTKRKFQYDPAGESTGQLLQSQYVHLQTATYSYDESGNILSKDGNSFLNHGWQLASITDPSGNSRSFEYTADGNLTKEIDLGSNQVTRTMSYDSHGRMTSVNSTTFVYDFRGRMIKATSGDGTVTYYPSECYEVSVQGNTTTQTAYLIHQTRCASISTVINPEKARQTSALYYHHDHLGSVVAVSNRSGEIVSKYWYDDFGTVTRVEGRDDSSRYKYSGKEVFEGLYYFGARFYDPTTGRFTALDNVHISLKGIVPATFNQYAFSRNDPVNFIDYNGNGPDFWHRLWHIVVDVAIIGLGMVVSAFCPPVGEIIIGGGIGGLAYDLIALVVDPGDSYDAQWGIAIASGMIFTGVGMVAEKALAGTIASITTKIESPALVNSFQRLGWQALRGAINFGTDVSIATADGVVQQLTYNGLTGQKWSDGLSGAAIGGVLGYLATKSFAKAASKIGKDAGEIIRARRAARSRLGSGRPESIEMNQLSSHNGSRRSTGRSFDFGSDDYWWDSLSTSGRGDDYWWDPMGTEWDGYLADILD